MHSAGFGKAASSAIIVKIWFSPSPELKRAGLILDMHRMMKPSLKCCMQYLQLCVRDSNFG